MLFIKHSLNKVPEPFVRISGLVDIEHRINRFQLFHLGFCNLFHADEILFFSPVVRIQLLQHIRLNLFPVTVKESRLILPKLFRLIKHIITEAFTIIHCIDPRFIYSRLRPCFSQKCTDLLINPGYCKRNKGHFFLAECLQCQFNKFSKEPSCLIDSPLFFNLLISLRFPVKIRNHPPLVHHRCSLRFAPEHPCFFIMSYHQRNLVIVSCHFQCLELMLFFIKVTDLTSVFIQIISDDISTIFHHDPSPILV